MTFGALIEQTALRLDQEGKQDIRGFRSAARKFLQLSGLTADSGCSDDLLSDDVIQATRAAAEKAGTLSAAGSAAWASRVRQLIATWERAKAVETGSTFAVVLRQGIPRGMSVRGLCREMGVDYNVIPAWLRGHLPSQQLAKTVVPRLDAKLKLSGRLVAALEGIPLANLARATFTEAQVADIKADRGELHSVIRYHAREGSRGFEPLLVRLSCRGAIRTWVKTNRPHRVPTLHASDAPFFEALDRELTAGGKILGAFNRFLGTQAQPAGAVNFRYARWSQRLRQEFDRLLAYKTTNPEFLDRVSRARWTSYVMPDGRTECPSADAMKKACASVFGYALRSGLVKSEAELRLAHVFVPELICGYISDLMQRHRRSTFNQADRVLIERVDSLIFGGSDEFDGRGFFANDAVAQDYWSDSFFAKRLPTTWTPIAQGGYRIQAEPLRLRVDDFAGRWQAYLYECNRKLARFQQAHEYRKGDYTGAVADVLGNPDFDIGGWIQDGFRKLLSRVPPRGGSPRRWAEHVRLCVVYLFLCTRGYRRQTQLRLELSHIVWDGSRKCYLYRIPEDLFKLRGKGGSKGGVHAAVDDILDDFESVAPGTRIHLPGSATALLDLYIKEARPLLGIKGNSFFGWHTGDGMRGGIEKATTECLGRRISGHAFRYLIATWCKRMGLPADEAATILGQMPKTTQGFYDKTGAIDRGREVNASLRKLYKGRRAAA